MPSLGEGQGTGFGGQLFVGETSLGGQAGRSC